MSNLAELSPRFVGLPYIDGKQDCYGLVRRAYHEAYGILLRNYARPIGFDHDGLDLITDNFRREGFEVVEPALTLLEPGDGLLFKVASKTVNHVGVITCGTRFLHHLYQRSSAHDTLDPRWQNRLYAIVRHPDVTELNKQLSEKVDLLSLLPPHLREKALR